MNKGFTIIKILIAVFIVVFIGAGGYIVYTKNNTGVSEETVRTTENDPIEIPQSKSAIQENGVVKDQNEEQVAQEEPESIPQSTPEPASEPVPTSEPEPIPEPEPTPDPEQPPPPPVPTCILSISPNTITEGENATLSWSSSYAGSGTINQGVGAMTPVESGSRSISPTVSTTYTATITGDGGTATCSASLTVHALPLPPPPSSPQTVTVTYTNNGFSSKTTTINQGDTVLFVNNSTHSMWVSSNLHPVHTGYPEHSPSDCLGSSFDSCTDIAPGSSWSFIFNSIGSWGYHNHTRVGKTGTIVVQ